MKFVFYLLLTLASFRAVSQMTPKPAVIKSPDLQIKDSINLLKQVTINGKILFVKQQIDRTIITVNEQVRKLANNALELIALAPGLQIADDESAVLMDGKEAVQVMINDKPVKLSGRDLMKLLKSIPAADLAQLEVMSNPSAKYDVKGNSGLLNIRTIQRLNNGFTGNLNLSTSQGIHNMGDYSGLLNYGSSKFAIDTYLAYHNGTYQTRYNQIRVLDDGLLKNNNINSDQWHDPVIRITADYFFNPKNTLSALVENERSRNISAYETSTVLSGATDADNTYSIHSYRPNITSWHTYNLNYRFKDAEGTSFILDLDRSDNDKTDKNVLTGDVNGGRLTDGHFYRMATGIGITSVKGDFEKTWPAQLKLEAGFKFSIVSTDNDFLSQSIPANQQQQQAILQEDVFVYQEKVNSLYATLGKSFGKWGIQAGLRAEQSRVKGTLTNREVLVKESPDSSYLNLLPAVYLTYNPTSKHAFRLSYNQRITRPGYRDIQPFTYQLDALSYQSGNPRLRVQKSSVADFSYTIAARITFSGSYTVTKDFINPVVIQKGDEIYESTGNTGEMKNWNFNLSYPLTVTKFWTMQNKLNVFNNHFDGRLYQGDLEEGKWSFGVSSVQRFTLPGKYLFQVSGRYSSASQKLIYYQSGSGNVGVSLSKKIFKERGSFRIGYSDLFNTQRNTVKVDFGGLKYIQNNSWESQRLSLDFSWSFGDKKVRKIEERSIGAREEKNRGGK